MQHAFGQHGTRQLSIVNFMIQLTGTYEDQFARPFEAQVNGDLINAVSEQVFASRSAPAAMFSSGLAATMIQPSAVPERNIVIPNGWGMERLRFMLRIKREDHMGTLTFINVAGFTDYADLSLQSNYIDPRTRFIINTINVTRPTTIRSPFGSVEQQAVVSTNQLVINRDFQPILSNGSNSVFSIAPDNVFTKMQADEYAMGAQPGDLLDTRHHLTGQPRLMQRAHNSAPQYCSAIMDTWRNLTQAAEYTESHDKVMDECAQALRSSMAQENPFIDFLMKRMRQESGYMTSFDGSFTYADLLALDSNVELVKSIVPAMGGMNRIGQSAYWNSADGLTLAASTLAQAVPSYMAGLGFGSFRFTATNNTIGGEIVVLPGKEGSFNSSVDQSREVDTLLYRIKNEVLNSITFGNQVSFTLTMHVDVFGETRIELTLNGENRYFVAPTFADALAVPTVTIDESRLKNICYDIKSVFDNVWEQGVKTAGAPNLTGNIRI